jgi:hypothetical protein
VSPDGRYVAFGGSEELTGQPSGGVQVFRYDAAAGSLVCASCDPDGSVSPPVALSSSPGGHRQHFVADDGRVFFDATGPLVVHYAEGGATYAPGVDVYEFEDAGTGTCGSAGGCRSLISGGSGYAALAYVSAEGNDVFFTTPQELVPEDEDSVVDMYDARVGGHTPSASAGCESGGICHETVPQALAGQTVGSATFNGPGNPPAGPPSPGGVVVKGC